MINKVKEKWSKCSRSEKALTILALVAIPIYLVMLFIIAFGVMEGAEAIAKLIMGVFWSLLGIIWWKRKPAFAVIGFGIALGNFVLGVLFLLN